jgi:hypothetical protein
MVNQVFAITDAAPTSCWLAALTAQRLLPCFQQHYLDDTLPQELLTLALKLLHGEEQELIRVEDMLVQGYHALAEPCGHLFQPDHSDHVAIRIASYPQIGFRILSLTHVVLCLAVRSVPNLLYHRALKSMREKADP